MAKNLNIFTFEGIQLDVNFAWKGHVQKIEDERAFYDTSAELISHVKWSNFLTPLWMWTYQDLVLDLVMFQKKWEKRHK